jgi:hypothetical protein
MKKFLPHLPLFALVFGLFIVQIQNHSATAPLLSNTLSPISGEITVEVCSKPEQFSAKDESAWCNTGLASNIEQYLHTWSWSCMVGERVHVCHFTENVAYPTRGGILFKK